MEYPNWFDDSAKPNFEVFLKEKESITALQIGAYTGDASKWMLDNVKDLTLVDVDTWEGSDEPQHKDLNWSSVESVYDEKTSGYDRLIKYKGTSDHFFKKNELKFEFIYIDGDHTSYGVLKDAVNAYECLNSGGILAFDDYGWSIGQGRLTEPRTAIDAFLDIYSDKVTILLKEYQVWCLKK